MRANYLAYIQRHAELRNHPSPIGHGWEMMNSHCRPVRYTKLDLPGVLPHTQAKNKWVTALIQSVSQIYCTSGNIREVLISRTSRGGQIREFKNHVKIIIIIALY